MHWYYEKNNQRIGPVTDQEIERMAGEGTITPETRVWNETTGQWSSYGDVKAGRSGNASSRPTGTNAGATVACSQCGKRLPAEELIQYEGLNICAACKTSFFQKVKEGAVLPGSMVYAGFWIRAGAKIIDGLITYVLNMIIAFVASMVGGSLLHASTDNPAVQLGITAVIMLVQIAVNAAYATYFVGKYQATPGKMALGLMVVAPDRGRVSYARALGRHFAEMLSGIILGIGYFMVAFDNEKRALHDRICDTRVIRKAR